jgi:hypothetical protein
MRASNGGDLRFNGGALTQGTNGRVVADGAGSTVTMVGGSYAGGTVEALNGGAVVPVGSVTWTNVQPVGPMQVPNGTVLSIGAGGVSHDALWEINPTGGTSQTVLVFPSGGTFGGTGTVVLNATQGVLDRAYLWNQSGTPAVIGTERTLRGTGHIYGLWTVQGVLAPGTDVAVGDLRFVNALTLAPESALTVRLGGATTVQVDRVSGSGARTLGGTLNVSVLSPFVPAAGSRFVVLTGGSITGRFATTNFPATTGGREWRVRYSATEVIVGLFCRADLNGDDEFTFDDIQSFVALYNANDPGADINNDGEWTFDDIQAYIALYNSSAC